MFATDFDYTVQLAEQGDSDAQYRLGRMYEKGMHNFTQDYEEDLK